MARKTSSTQPFIPYVRVSRMGGRSGDGFISVKEQMRTNEQAAQAAGVPLLPEPFEDKDRSGGNLNREELQRALQLIQDGKAGGLVVATLDRFSRDAVEALTTLRDIEAAGGKLIAGDQGAVTLSNGADAFQATIGFAVGEFGRARQREYLGRSVRNAIERGVHLGVPYGYRRVGKGTPLQVEPREAEAVKLAYRLRADGLSWPKVADALNEAGHQPRPWKRHGVTQQAQWTHKTVRQMVGMEVYLGTAHNGEHRTPGAHPALVTPEQWRKANRAGKGGRPVGDKGHLLSGVARCSSCGYVMTHSTSGNRQAQRYYRCKGQRGGGKCSHPAMANAVELEALVMEKLQELVGQASIRASRGDGDVETARAARQDIQDKLATAVRNFATADLSSAAGQVAQQVVTELEAELEAADVAVDRAEATASSELGDLEAKLAQWDELDVAEQRHLVRSVVQCVVVSPGGGRWHGVPLTDRTTLVPVGPEVPAEAVRLIPWVAGRKWGGR